MSREIDRQEIAIRYLLGTLSEEEMTRLEEAYFLDDAEFEQLEIAEDELIDQYVKTELSAEETRQFEKLLVSPRLSERVEIARILAQRAASPPQKQELTPTPEVPNRRVEPRQAGWWDRLFGPAAVATPAFRPAMAVAMTFMLLTTVALIFVWSKLRAESLRLAQEQQQREQLQRQIENERARYAQLDEQLKQTRQEKEDQLQHYAEKYEQLAKQRQSAQPLAFSFVLNPTAGVRGSGGDSTPTIPNPSGVPSVEINVNVTHGDYASYNAVVRNIDSGNEVARRNNLKPVPSRGKNYITLKVDSKRLPPGSYNVHVDGVIPTGEETFDDYPFRVRVVSR